MPGDDSSLTDRRTADQGKFRRQRLRKLFRGVLAVSLAISWYYGIYPAGMIVLRPLTILGAPS
jgi:hypothetical protein